MSVIFSRQCEYALQAVLFLAKRPVGSLTSIRDLTDSLGIPYDFLAKILQGLASKGLLISQKGSAGGFGLARPAKDITLFQIVKAIDGTDFLDACVMGFPECSSKNPCAVHKKWGALRDDIHTMLETKSIEEMAREMKKPQYLKA
jgi:Rrf2 family protein